MAESSAHIEHLEGSDFQKSRAFSPAVITQGGKTVWLAGQTATTDEAGKDIAGNFEAQARTSLKFAARFSATASFRRVR